MAVTATSSDVASAVWAQKYNTHSVASSFGSRFERWVSSGMTVRASDMSDIRSAVTAATFTLSASDISDVASAVWANAIGSDVNSKVGKLASRITKEVANASQLLLVKSVVSDAHSAAILAASHASDAYSAALLTQSLASDIDSALTSRFSDLHSLLSTTLGASDLYSKVQKLSSRITVPVATQSKLGVIESYASDIYSQVSDFRSDLHSFVSTTGVGLNASTMSDLRSAITAGPAAADATSIASAVWAHATASDATSKIGKLTSRIGKSVATASMLSDFRSDIHSFMSTTGVGLNASTMSDLRSAVAAVSAVVGASAISDIASAVWAHGTAASLVSRVSDVQSALDSQYTKVYSAVQVAGLTVSAMSDIASQVWAHATAASLVSRVSDIQSALDSQFARLSDYTSDIVSKLTVVKSIASDAHSAAILAASHASDAYSVALLNRSLASDAHSAAVKGYSQVLLTISMLSDVQSALDSQYLVITSTLSDIDSALTSQYTAGQNLNASALSDIASAIDARLDVAFTDATSLNTNSLKDRIRRMNWILQNRMKINDTTGNAVLYKDDNATAAYTVTAAVTDDGTSTIRKRLE
jgi:trimeric autotransporter adhesin